MPINLLVVFWSQVVESIKRVVGKRMEKGKGVDKNTVQLSNNEVFLI